MNDLHNTTFAFHITFADGGGPVLGACLGAVGRRRRWRPLPAQKEGAAAGGCIASAAAPEVRQRKPRKREELKRLPLNPEEPAGSVARWRWDPDKSPWWRLMRRRGVRIVGTRAYNKFLLSVLGFC